MRSSDVAAELLHAVYRLSTTRPHEADPRGYTRAEWPIYCEGYHRALLVALCAMDYALRRLDRLERTKRRRARVERARAASLAAATVGNVREQIGMSRDDVVENLAEGRQDVYRELEVILLLRDGVPPLQFGKVGGAVPSEPPSDAGDRREIRHTLTVSLDGSPREPQQGGDSSPVPATASDVAGPGAPVGPTCTSSRRPAGTTGARRRQKTPLETSDKLRG